MNMAMSNPDNHLLLQTINSMNPSAATTIVPIHSFPSIGGLNPLTTLNIAPINPLNTSLNYNQLLHHLRSGNNNFITHSMPSVPMIQPVVYTVPPNMISNLLSNRVHSTVPMSNNQPQAMIPATYLEPSNNANNSRKRLISNRIPINNNNPFCMALEDTKQSNNTSLTDVKTIAMNQLIDVIMNKKSDSVSTNSNDTTASHESNQECLKPHQCRYCFKSFAQRKDMMQHETIHNGLKPFPCQLCGKRFDNKACLHAHIGKKHSKSN
eukprot:58800_1